jgi:PAS domain S-box-containing protein
MTCRADLVDLFALDEAAFASTVVDVLTREGLATDRRRAVAHDGPDAFSGPDGLSEFAALSARERDLVWRVWLLDDVSLGLTVSGPAYQDNPILYANRTLRRMTGYPLSDLVGANPRLLQGPDTEPGPAADLREAIDIWVPVTVELTNYRRDGSAFRNRVSLLPMDDETGTVSNWVGVQEVVDGDGSATGPSDSSHG